MASPTSLLPWGGSRALDAWYRKYAATEMRDVKFCLAFVHYPGAFHANKKITVPNDINGLKVRPANAGVANFVTQLGGTNVQASATEVRDILEKGVAEAVTFPPGEVVFFGIDKILKYHMDAPLYTSTFAFTLNKTKYDAMSAFQKNVINDHCTTEWAGNVAGPFAEFSGDGAKLKTELGLYTLTPGQLALWKKAAEPLEKRWAESVRKVGVDPIAAIKELKEQLAKYNAGY